MGTVRFKRESLITATFIKSVFLPYLCVAAELRAFHECKVLRVVTEKPPPHAETANSVKAVYLTERNSQPWAAHVGDGSTAPFGDVRVTSAM
jgi:hypothetical protein